MSRKELIKESLEFARNYSEGLFGQFTSADEWVFQTHGHANHALWCAGHIALADNLGISLVAPDKADLPDRYESMFGRGSNPVSDTSKYPDPKEVLAYMKERREVLLSILDGLSDADLDRATPDDAPDFLPTVRSVFTLLSWHEGLHAGQASIAHRGLNKPSVLG